jgi:hypothetical protein
MSARANFVGEATFSGCIAFCTRPRAELEAWLPAGTRFASADSGGSTSVVAFAFGTHTGSATRFGGFDLRLGIVYQELGIFLPWVARATRAEPELYVARMFSSFYPAVWNGNTHYGFAKELVEIHRLGALFTVIGPERRTLLEAVTEPVGEWRLPSRGSDRALEQVREIFALPVLGRLADGRFVRSRFSFEFAAARVRDVDACVALDESEYVDGPSGSLEVSDMTWRLSWPETAR